MSTIRGTATVNAKDMGAVMTGNGTHIFRSTSTVNTLNIGAWQSAPVISGVVLSPRRMLSGVGA
jgi:hypothetical protein